jgi:pimeloyl-ACP methyl ester carboxylesterase
MHFTPVLERSLKPALDDMLLVSPALMRMRPQHNSCNAQVSMWSQLPSLQPPLLVITGQLDDKFCVIARHMAKVVTAGRRRDHASREEDARDNVQTSPHTSSPRLTTVCVPDAGHAVHVERPWPVLRAISRFLQL